MICLSGKRLISALLLTGAFALHALEPVTWANKMTEEFVTPHLKWMQKPSDGPIKTLFFTYFDSDIWTVTGQMGSRQVIEWVQRGDFDYQVITASGEVSRDKKSPAMTVFRDSDSWSSQMYSDGKSSAKRKEIEEKLKRNYELYVFNGLSFNALDTTFKLHILKEVMKGAGLVLIADVETDLPQMFRQPDMALTKSILNLSPLDGVSTEDIEKKLQTPATQGKVPFCAYTLGKGRIIRIARYLEPAMMGGTSGPYFYIPSWSNTYRNISPERRARQDKINPSPVNAWWNEFEMLNAFALRSFFFAAGRSPNAPLTVDASSGLKLKIDNSEQKNGELRWRLRDFENKIVTSGQDKFSKATTISVPLPPLPNGDYTVDFASTIDGKLDDFGYYCFPVSSGPKATLAMADEYSRVYDGKPIKLKLNLSSPVKNAEIGISLTDSPLDRLWAQKKYTNMNGSTFELEFDRWYLPKLAGILRVEVKNNGVSIAKAVTPVFRPEGNRIPDWLECLCYNTPTPVHQLVQASQGWNAITYRVDGTYPVSIPNYMLLGMISQPSGPLAMSVFGNRIGNPTGFRLNKKTDETEPNWSRGYSYLVSWSPTPEEMKEVESEQADFKNHQKIIRIIFNAYMRHTKALEFGTQLFMLGDETGPAYDCMKGKYITGKFHDYLKQQYGSIEKLNTLWNRSYKSFEEIPYLTTSVAAQQSRIPEGGAMRSFVEMIFFGTIFKTLGNEFKQHIPNVVYGRHSDHDNQQIVVNMPQISGEFSHYTHASGELQRTMRPDFYATSLSGYDGSAASYPNCNYWTGIVAGALRGCNYFINAISSSGMMNADYTDMRPKFTAGRLQMAAGLGNLLHGTPLEPAQFAVYSSAASEKAAILSSGVAAAQNYSSTALFEYAYFNGLGIDHLTGSAMKRLMNRYKVLFLSGVSAVSTEEAADILAFAEKGGIVIADVNPAVYNEHLGIPSKNPLEKLFGDLKPASRMGKIPFRGFTLDGVAGIAPMQQKSYGKGKGILLNFTLNNLQALTGDNEKFFVFLKELFEPYGIRSTIKADGLPQGTVMRLRNGDGFRMIALTNNGMAEKGEGSGRFTVTFPETGYIYEVGKGYIGCSNQATVENFNPPLRVFTCFKQRQNAPAMKFDSKTIQAGGELKLDISGFPAGRVYSLQIIKPDGQPLRPRNEVETHERIICDGKRKSFPIHFAFSDPKGDYRLILTDIATGLNSTQTINLK